MLAASLSIPGVGQRHVQLDYCHQDYLVWLDQMLAAPDYERYRLRPCRTGTSWQEGRWHLVTVPDHGHSTEHHLMTPELGAAYRRVVQGHRAPWEHQPIPKYDGVTSLRQISSPTAHLVDTVCEGDARLEVLELSRADCLDQGEAMADVIVAHDLLREGVLRAETICVLGEGCTRTTAVAPIVCLQYHRVGHYRYRCWQLYLMGILRLPDEIAYLQRYLSPVEGQPPCCQVCTFVNQKQQRHYRQEAGQWVPITPEQVFQMSPPALVNHPDLPPTTVPRVVTLLSSEAGPVGYQPRHEYTPPLPYLGSGYAIQVWVPPSRAKSARGAAVPG